MTFVPFIPPLTPWILPREGFEAILRQAGQRIVWQKSHTCPCVYSGSAVQGRLPFPGSAQPECQQCFGTGTYWDTPSAPFTGLITFMHMSPSPDEPGVLMDPQYGPVQSAEPTLTIPFMDPYNPTSSIPAWGEASTNDQFIAIDMQSRFTAVLQVGGITALPYQQNLSIALSGAVTTYDSNTGTVTAVSGYTVSGASIFMPSGTAEGTNYMVEFQSAPIYVAFRRAGGLPHIRPFGGGTVNEPRRFRLQELDLWTRQRQGSTGNPYPTPYHP